MGKQSRIQVFYEKFKGSWWFITIVYILGAITWHFIGDKISHPSKKVPKLDIEYAIYQTSPYNNIYTGLFDFAPYQKDSIYGIYFNIKNIGTREARDLKILLELANTKNKIMKKEFMYRPRLISRYIIDSVDCDDSIYRELEKFPRKAKMDARILTSQPINGEGVVLEFMSELKSWLPKKSDIELVNPFAVNFNLSLIEFLYADSIPDMVADLKVFPMGDSMLIIVFGDSQYSDSYYIPTFKSSMSWRGMESFRIVHDRAVHMSVPFEYVGYDMGTVFHKIDLVLEKYDFLDSLYIRQISDYYIMEEDSGDVIIDPLQRCENLLNLFIRQKLINYDEASALLNNSRETGGFTIEGYNLLFISSSLLDVLYEDGYITLKDGETIVASLRRVSVQ